MIARARLLAVWLGFAALGFGCQRGPEDAIFAEIRRTREEANALTQALDLPGVEVVAGEPPWSPLGPRMEAFRRPGAVQVGGSFDLRFTVASADASRTREIALYVQNAESHLRIPAALDPATALMEIAGTLQSRERLPALPATILVAAVDEEGTVGPPITTSLELGQLGADYPFTTALAHEGSALALAFTPGPDSRLLSGGLDGPIVIHDLQTNHQLRTLRGHSAAVLCLAVTSDGSRLASASADQTVRLWDLASGELLHTLGYHTDAVSAVAFSPDDGWLVSGGRDRHLQIRRHGDWTLEREVDAGDRINAVAFAPTADRLAVGTGRLLLAGSVEIYETAGWQLERQLVLEREVTAVGFSADGRQLAAASGRGEIRIWDVESGTLLHTLIGGGADTVPSLGFWPGAPHMLGAITLSGFATIWDVPAESIVSAGRLPVPLTVAEVSPDGYWVVFGDSLGQLYLQIAFDPSAL